jgi:hypothetical protein
MEIEDGGYPWDDYDPVQEGFRQDAEDDHAAELAIARIRYPHGQCNYCGDALPLTGPCDCGGEDTF